MCNLFYFALRMQIIIIIIRSVLFVHSSESASITLTTHLASVVRCDGFCIPFLNIWLSCVSQPAAKRARKRVNRPLITYAMLVIFCSCLFEFMAGDGRQQEESSTNFINISFSSAIIRGPYDLACACVAGALPFMMPHSWNRTRTNPISPLPCPCPCPCR